MSRRLAPAMKVLGPRVRSEKRVLHGYLFTLHCSLFTVVLAACASRPARLVTIRSSLAETLSLLGDTLYPLPLSGSGGPQRVRNIATARDAMQRDSNDVNNRLRLARATVDLSRFREAVAIYNRIAEVYFNNPRVFRERGEVLLRLRHLDGAIADFRKAGLLAIGRGPIYEVASRWTESDSVVQPVFSTVQFQTFFLQGVALYCKGDWRTAYEVLAEAARAAPSTDDLTRALLWLFFAARRVGSGTEGTNVLALVKPEWAARSDLAELRLLFAYKGIVSTDSIRAWTRNGPAEDRVLYRYGIAYSLLLRPSRREDAELWLEEIRRSPDWSALPFLAAEADLARMRGARTVVR